MPRRPAFFGLLVARASFLLVACGSGSPGRAPSDELVAGFADPPGSSRPWVYWMWMDGNLTREGLTSDLESMRDTGLGGVVICDVNAGVPRGPVAFMSAEWRALFKHVVKEAERLGLEVTERAFGLGRIVWVRAASGAGPDIPPEASPAGARRPSDVLHVETLRRGHTFAPLGSARPGEDPQSSFGRQSK